MPLMKDKMLGHQEAESSWLHGCYSRTILGGRHTWVMAACVLFTHHLGGQTHVGLHLSRPSAP